MTFEFDEDDYPLGSDDMVIVDGIDFASTCQLHVAPVWAGAHPAYIPGPDGWVIAGLSDLSGAAAPGLGADDGQIARLIDDPWERVEPIMLELDPPKATGRRRADARQMLNGIIFRLRSRCQWNRLPRDLGDYSTIHRTMQRRVELGVFERVWGILGGGVRCPERRGLGVAVSEWSDGQGPLGGDLIGRSPTDPGKPGVKRSLLVDAQSDPFSIAVAGEPMSTTLGCASRPWRR